MNVVKACIARKLISLVNGKTAFDVELNLCFSRKEVVDFYVMNVRQYI